ncbi:MAG: C69 family dipeptidase [Rikenellaceae bacterium]
MKIKLIPTLLALAALALNVYKSDACTNLLITRGASQDGSTMLTYAADSHSLYGEAYFNPRTKYAKGEKLKIYEWDTGKYLGEIDQVEETYSTISNMNEHQVVITETTFGGLPELRNNEGIMDYGSLIYVTLQRAKTAREAIDIMTSLVAEYGYYSSGESFSISDKNDVWIMEMMGKGEGKKGAVWVAMKIPDGYVSAHANQARITQFPLNDPENCIYAEDVISLAREKGLYSGKDKDFSFSDVYAPLDFGAMRFCEARVWSAFNIMTKGGVDEYLDYAMGYDSSKRMPLWVKPAEKLSVKEVADIMRDHYEGTPMDMRTDIGAGGNEVPYRWRPMTFEVDGKTYLNERAIATQQTGFWLLGQARDWLPDAVGGIIWFGTDDAGTSYLTPIYSSSVAVPHSFEHGNGSMTEYSDKSAFWLTNRVTNYAYGIYNFAEPIIRAKIDSHMDKCMAEIPAIDKAAVEIYNECPEKAREFLTKYSSMTAADIFEQWVELDKYLVVKFIDGNIKVEDENGFKDNGNNKGIPARPETMGYSKKWQEAVVKDAGEKLLSK